MCTCALEVDKVDTSTVMLLLFLLGRLDQAAAIDERSGFPVYDAWRTRAAPILARPRGTDDCCGLLVIDIDNFKGVNDTYGHLAGDNVIEATANVIRHETRKSDVVGRFGGDEFVVLLDSVESREAVELVAERIREGVKDLIVSVGSPSGPRPVTGLTVSIGGALHSANDSYPDLTAFCGRQMQHSTAPSVQGAMRCE